MARAVLFVHLALSPIVVSRWTLEAFEHTKVALLLAAAIVLAGLAPRALAPAVRGLVRDPRALGSLLLLASAVVSTVLSRSPWTSLLGAHESYFGLTTLLAYAVLFVVSPEARFNLAQALEQQGRRDEAIGEYRRLLAAQPDYTLARDALRALGDTAAGK